LCHNQRVIEEIREEIKTILKFNVNECKTYKNLWETVQATLRGKFIALTKYTKNTNIY
jgi:hypothetical protein